MTDAAGESSGKTSWQNSTLKQQRRLPLWLIAIGKLHGNVGYYLGRKRLGREDDTNMLIRYIYIYIYIYKMY
jgi:hypothetical protein